MLYKSKNKFCNAKFELKILVWTHDVSSLKDTKPKYFLAKHGATGTSIRRVTTMDRSIYNV